MLHRLDMLPYIKALKIGAVISRPGARVQRFHCDATHAMFAAAQADPLHRIYNVFIPLVDLCEDGDGTEFWVAPSLQVLSLLLSLLDGTKVPMLTPEELLFLQRAPALLARHFHFFQSFFSSRRAPAL